MIYWIVITSIWTNFIHGALIPITPQLNEKMAGLAFSSFVIIKILAIVPAGIIGDRIGHFWGLWIGLFFQFVTLVLIKNFPEYVWAGRACEGIALAFGIISALALCRIYAKDQTQFGKSLSLLMGIGSIGFILGPIFGFMVKPNLSLQILLIGSLLLLSVHLTLLKVHKNSLVDQIVIDKVPTSIPWILVLGLALVKGLAMGTEPLLGWWAIHNIGLDSSVAGITFVFAAAGFIIGNFKPSLFTSSFGLLGLVLLEISLDKISFLWWPSMLFIGLFSGSSLNLFLRKLGWNKPASIGVQNSKWMIFADIPMAIAPVVLWELKETTQFLTRAPILFLSAITVLWILKYRA